jgi:putative transposase
LKPPRADNFGTYFISSNAVGQRALFQTTDMAELLIDTILRYRDQSRYLLHDFVVMPKHLHLIISPTETLERAMQLIKGGFSFRAKKELHRNFEIWQQSFTDHRVRDYEDYLRCKEYEIMNPVRKGLCSAPQDYPYSSADGKYQLDPLPQRLKPLDM